MCSLSAAAVKTLSHAFLPAVVLSGLVLVAAPKPVEDVSRATLDNGLRVVIVRSSLAPVVTTVVNYLVGSNEAPQGFPGTAHALEHMMFRGSPDLSADQLGNIAAAMGGDFNAETQQSVTRFFFTVPKQDLDVALHIESIRMRDLLATDALWDHERGAIEQEVAGDLSDPEYVFYTELLSGMFRGTPYEHDALGTRPSFNATTAAMLKQFHNTWYAPNNAILVIAGDVDPAATMATVKDLFGAIPAKTLPARAQVELEPVKPETLHLTTDLPYGLAVAAFRWPGSKSPDFAAAQVLADVLSSQRGSLYDLVPRGQALSASFSFDSFPEASLAYAQAAFPAGGNGAVLLHQIQEILEDIAKNGVPADLVNAAKRHEVADTEFQKNSISDLAMLLVGRLSVGRPALPERRHPGNSEGHGGRRKACYAPAFESAGIDIGHSDATGLGSADSIVIIRQTRIFCDQRERGRSASCLGTKGESALDTSFECASANHDTVEWIKTDRAAGDSKRHGQRLRPCPEQFWSGELQGSRRRQRSTG